MVQGDDVLAEHRRRSWSLAQKLAILEELASSGDPLAEGARRHGMNADHLQAWRGRARARMLAGRRGLKPAPGQEVGFVQVGVVGAGAAPAAAERIEVERVGGARVHFREAVDPGRLHAVLLAVRSAL